MKDNRIIIERIYEDRESVDRYRILVDRVWPRGISKEKAHLDEWLKEIAPSTELRKWFSHDPQKYNEFKQKYKQELEVYQEELERIKTLSKEKEIVLLYGAKDKEHNQAVILLEILENL